MPDGTKREIPSFSNVRARTFKLYPRSILNNRSNSPEALSRAQIPIAFLPHRSPAARFSHYFLTRFRALALFGRRSSERVARSSLPAAENLHITGREQVQQI